MALKGTLSVGQVSITNPLIATGSVVVAVGDLIVAGYVEHNSLTATGVTDNLGNIYTAKSAGTDAGTTAGRAFWSIATVAGTLTAVNCACTASSNDGAFAAAVFGGPFTASPLDASPTDLTNDTTTPYACPATGVMAQASELVVGILSNGLGTVASAVSPFLLAVTKMSSTEGATVSNSVAICYQIVSATTSVAPSFTTVTTPASNVLMTMSFKIGAATTDGAGSSAGTSTPAATGSSTAASPGSSAGTSTPAATGSSTAAGDGSSAGAATVEATATDNEAGDGSSDGISIAAATGSSTAAGDGFAAGTAAADATGNSTATGDGSSDGIAAAEATGDSTAESSGSSAGTATATATSSAAGDTEAGDGLSAGSATAAATGRSTAAGDSSSAGTATAAATGDSTEEGFTSAAGSSAGAATVVATGDFTEGEIPSVPAPRSLSGGGSTFEVIGRSSRFIPEVVSARASSRGLALAEATGSSISEAEGKCNGQSSARAEGRSTHSAQPFSAGKNISNAHAKMILSLEFMEGAITEIDTVACDNDFVLAA